MAIISVKGICQAYGKRVVLSGLSLEVEQGEILAIPLFRQLHQLR